MKLLLRETVDKLGTIGEIVAVPDGYGRNFLLPQGIAVAVTPENIRRLDAKKQELLAAEATKRGDAEGLAGMVRARQVTIPAKAAGEEGKLYGSVTAQAIADQLRKDGLPVEARMVLLDHPIKELGVFDVRVRLFPGVEAEAKVWVVEEGAAVSPEAKAEAAAAKEAEARKQAARDRAPRRKAPEAEARSALPTSLEADSNEDNEAVLNAKLKPVTKKEKRDEKRRGRRRG